MQKKKSIETAVNVVGLSKCYQIYDRPSDRLKQFVFPRLQRIVHSRPKQYYRDFWALKDISFEIKKGETVGIIGKNGSGKSTLLQLICGTLSPTSGFIQTHGLIAALLELGSGFNPDFTGRENVYLNASIHGFTKKQIDQRINDIFSFADIGDFVDLPVKMYSSGMFVRLAFATQAFIDPDILIVDEALSVGDSYFVHKCMLRFHYLREKGTTILLVTHDATTIKTLCNTAIWIDRGHIESIGSASTVVDQYMAAIRKLPVYKDFSDKKSELNIRIESNQDDFDGSQEHCIPNIDRRIGNQACRFIGIGLYDEHMHKKTAVSNNSKITLRVTFKNFRIEEGRHLVLGYSLRNNRGVDIASNNSEIEKTEIKSPPAGQSKTIRMYIHIPELISGSYSFSVSIGTREIDGRMQSLDGITNAIVFDILSDRLVHVLMSLRTEFVEEVSLITTNESC